MHAERLSQVLLEYAQQETNPVLELIGDQDFIQEQKYYLPMQQIPLQAYYHSHKAPAPIQGEHGHFHVFIRVQEGVAEDCWAHLAALSIDPLGQPMAWFCVNQWVSGGTWEDSHAMMNRLREILGNPVTSEHRLARWLHGLLGMYQESLAQLLAERDRLLAHWVPEGDHVQSLQDRSLYRLGYHEVHLARDIRRIYG